MAHDGHGHGPGDDPNFVNDKPYETRDFALGTVFKSLFFLFVFVGATSLLTVGIFRIMVPTTDERTTAFPLPQVRVEPPQPRLQANPTLDIKTFREEEQAATTSYGFDAKTRDIHIPIDRALEMVAQEGLPTRANPGAPNPQEPNEPSYTQGEAPPGTPTTLPDASTLRNARPPANRAPQPATGAVEKDVPPVERGGMGVRETEPNSGTATPIVPILPSTDKGGATGR